MRIKLIFILLVISLFLIAGCENYIISKDKPIILKDNIFTESQLPRFKSGDELVRAFEKARESGRSQFGESTTGILTTATAKSSSAFDSERDYSETNIQVESVDEADIIKTDGNYIYTLAKEKLIIVKAYPSYSANILSIINLDNFNPAELFIDRDRLLIFGSTNYNLVKNLEGGNKGIMPYSRNVNIMSIRLYDISDKRNPELLRTIDFEGDYLTSRKIDSDVYFIVNSYPYYYREESAICEEIIPLYRESNTANQPKDMRPIAKCTEIGYIEPIQAQNFITIASISMTNENIEKETIVGSGQNVYASLDNLYVVQTSWPKYSVVGGLIEDYFENTIITKFELDNGNIKFIGAGNVKGHILNQFSMDEYDDYFRIATTIGQVSRSGGDSSNNVYILDKDLEVVGELEDLAPGEKIYSVRFMGKKGYVVTFKKVDPLFVIDLSDPENPEVLGKLKIPGYSDYLHPYNENHIIGIGKETVEAEEGDFAWYQGIKMAIFDVSDVKNPIELHKVIIGDRGTDSDILRDHKAFLFDKKRNLLVIPVLLAEIKGEKTRDNQHGEFTFQGAYAYDITLEDGFNLKGRVTHYDDEEIFLKSGYYFRGDSSIKRSLYIEDVLYTLSDNRLQLNDLNNLNRLKVIEFAPGNSE
ncbi:beta-propeller domain-containing protein [Candidatus Woesearchaeota archaeon]|nr:beta-propeller domain-containing protein [Candidatus Woesearchaeota archaeon]